MVYPSALFTFLSFLGTILVTSCLPWNWQAWNAGSCLYILWTALACLNQFVNSIVWNGNVDNKAPIWCDISTKFLIGSSVGIPASALCINRRIYKMVSTNTFPITRKEKMRALSEEFGIGLGIPLLEMVLHYITQGHRFDIFEDVGCFPATYNTWVAYLLVFCWPLAIGIVSTIYSIMNLIIINKPSSKLRLFLSDDNHTLNRQRYWRLTVLAAIDTIGTITISCFNISLNIRSGIRPWINWEDTHYNFSAVPLVPVLLWRQVPYASVGIEMSRWIPVLCAFLFFAVFGTSREARNSYRDAYKATLRWFGRFLSWKEPPIHVRPRTLEDGKLERRISLCTVETGESVILDISPQYSRKVNNVDTALPAPPLPTLAPRSSHPASPAKLERTSVC